MGTIRLTTSQALVRFLNSQFVEFDGKQQRFVHGVFTIFGHGNVLGLGQALEENPGELKVYQGRNEQGMANAAIAFAKQKHRKQIIACTASVGPGSANMITSAATATANNIPILLLPGDVFATRQPDPVLQQIEQTHDLSISTNDAFRAVSKYWDRINRPEQLMSALLNAMRVLTNSADTGAVTIALPQDVQAEAWDFPETFFEKRLHRIERRQPSSESVQDAVKLIRSKKRPLLILGGGVRYSEAAETFLQFAKKFHMPICETQAGKSAIESFHPLNLGGIGVTGNSAANLIAKEADLIIAVGTRFTDFTTASKHLFANADVLTINTSEFHAAKMNAFKVVADAKVGIEAISKELGDYCTAYGTDIENAKQNWEKELDRLKTITYRDDFKPEIAGHLDEKLPEYKEELKSNLTQTSVIGKLNDLIDDNAVIVGAAGSLPGDLQRMWVSKARNTYHMEYGYSCMGYEVAGALGAKLAEPNKEVYAMTGDGSFLMLHTELVTSIQEGQKINIILMDNAGFGCINNLQMGNGMGSFVTEFRKRNPETGQLDGAIMNINYAKVAEGYGVKTYIARTLKELEEAILDSKKQINSTLIDIKVLPKTMTNGYDAWWHVGVAETSMNESIRSAYLSKESNLVKARSY